MQSRLRLLAIGAGLFALVQAAHAIDPIKIGVTAAQPSSGPQAQGTRDGLEVALKMINETGGALGRPFELVFHDAQGTPEQAGAAIEKLVKQDKVTALVGTEQSAAALAEVEIAHRHKLPYI